MKKQDAIQYIRNAAWLGSNADRDKVEEAVEMAVEALKKQMPKKAELDVEDLICPVCGADVEWKRYCEECGQRIDTGDES